MTGRLRLQRSGWFVGSKGGVRAVRINTSWGGGSVLPLRSITGGSGADAVTGAGGVGAGDGVGLGGVGIEIREP